jgi:peptide-methionine (R)-S-oxide reductase
MIALKKVSKTEEEWRQTLTPEQYRVARMKGTERPFTGEYHDSKDEGTYRCAACGNELFTSEAKFDSGCGWPSFSEPAANENVRTELDTSHGMVRTEVLCAACDSHLGHVFNDGPRPNGLRYCINSVVLKLDDSPADSEDSSEDSSKDS